MPSDDTIHGEVLTSVRQHIAPIVVSVAISVLLCHLSLAILAVLGMGGALVLWLAGWRLHVTAPQKHNPLNEGNRHVTHTHPPAQ